MSAGIVLHNRVSADSVSIESQNIQIESIHKEGTGKPVEVYYAHNVRTVGLHNSGRLLFVAVREVEVVRSLRDSNRQA